LKLLNLLLAVQAEPAVEVTVRILEQVARLLLILVPAAVVALTMIQMAETVVQDLLLFVMLTLTALRVQLQALQQ
jgi:hypothetical protein